MVQSCLYFVREAIIGMYRARATNLVAVSIIAASVGVLGGFLLVTDNIRTLATDWDRVQINAYLRDEAVETRADEVDRLIESIRARPFVTEVRFVSRDEASRIFHSRFAELADAVGALQANPFPASIEISTRGAEGARAAWAQALVAELEAYPFVESVQDNEEDARRLLAVLTVVSTIGFGVGGVLAAASVFIIFNVIRLTVYARREEISIMRLVGATSGFIRGPFLVEGMLQGFLGALAALAALYLAHLALADFAERSGSTLAGLLTSRFLPAARIAALAGGGILIGLIGSALSLRRFLTE